MQLKQLVRNCGMALIYKSIVCISTKGYTSDVIGSFCRCAVAFPHIIHKLNMCTSGWWQVCWSSMFRCFYSSYYFKVTLASNVVLFHMPIIMMIWHFIIRPFTKYVIIINYFRILLFELNLKNKSRWTDEFVSFLKCCDNRFYFCYFK